jgi:hypothetical protein
MAPWAAPACSRRTRRIQIPASANTIRTHRGRPSPHGPSTSGPVGYGCIISLVHLYGWPLATFFLIVGLNISLQLNALNSLCTKKKNTFYLKKTKNKNTLIYFRERKRNCHTPNAGYPPWRNKRVSDDPRRDADCPKSRALMGRAPGGGAHVRATAAVAVVADIIKYQVALVES